jgi:hypothetical protein
MKNSNGSNKLSRSLLINCLSITAAVIIFGVWGLAAYQFGKQSQKESLSIEPTDTYTPQAKPTPTPLPSLAISQKTDNELIKEALFQKHNWKDDGTITVAVSTNDGKYSSGTVTALDGGGYFYAEKIGDKWEIVADGNGVILCSSLTKYSDFPKVLIPECYDSAAQKTIKR